MTRTTKKKLKQILVLENKPISLSVIVGDSKYLFTSYEGWQRFINRMIEATQNYYKLVGKPGTGRPISPALAKLAQKPIIL